MATLAPLDLGMIETAIGALDLKSSTDHDEQCCVVRYGYDDEVGSAMLFNLAVEGHSTRIFSLYCLTDRQYPLDARARLLAQCNTWNATARWPTASVQTFTGDDSSADGSSRGGARIMLEQHIPLPNGAYVSLIEDAYEAMFHASVDFWKALNREGDRKR